MLCPKKMMNNFIFNKKRLAAFICLNLFPILEVIEMQTVHAKLVFYIIFITHV